MKTDSRSSSDYWIIPFVFLTAFLAYYHLGYPLLNDNDVPWHMAAGAWLVEHRHVPLTDPFAYGNRDHPWYNLSWLWDLALGLVQTFSGAFGALIFTLAFGAGLVVALAARLLAMRIALPAAVLTAMVAGICMLDYITARPQLAGYALALAFHAILHRTSPSRGEGSYKHLLWLPPLMLLWVNAHGSFLVGFILLGAYAVEALVTKNLAWLGRLILIAAACAAVMTVNPYGPGVILGTLTTLDGSSTRYNMEWRPFSFTASSGVSVWLMGFILVSNFRTAAVSLADKLLAAAWLTAGMFSLRNGAFFILLSAPYVAACLDEQTRPWRRTRPDSPLTLWLKRQPPARLWAGCTAALALVVATLAALPHGERIESRSFSIKDAIDFAQAKYPDHRFLADYELGGQVMYHTQGKLKYFMDSRAGTAYSDEAIQDYLNYLRMGRRWDAIFAKRDLNGVITRDDSAFAAGYRRDLHRDAWKLVFEGRRANVYIAIE